MKDTRRFEHLLSPLKIGGVTVKNRFCMGPMGIGQMYDSRGVMTEETIEFFAERAKGGFGMIIVGAQQADNEVDPEIGASPLGFKRDPGLFRKQVLQLIDRTSPYGTKMFAQISAGLGRNYPIFKAPSPVEVYNFPKLTSKVLTKDEIHKKVDAVVKLAKIEKESGYAGVQIHAMHWGYLLDQFAMSITNHRTDEYGGSLENRLRMTKEIITGIRQECGDDFPVIMRMGLKSYIKALNKPSFDGSDEAGRTLEEGIAICRLLEEYGYDAIDLDMGIYDSFYYACPPSYIQQGFAIDMYAQAKQAVDIPILAGARMQDPFLAESAIADGKIDGVVLSRPSLADPDLPRKVQMGCPEKIRPCIACCQCFTRAMDDDKFVTCAVNPEVYKELHGKIRKAVVAKRVVVVGGGVGGMEAARRARIAGHEVSLYEKGDSLGGLLLAAGAQALKKEIHQLVAWYENQLEELKVDVHLNCTLDVEQIKSINPDTVILATGSSPSKLSFIPGVNKPHVFSCVDALTAKQKEDFGQNVVVIGGGHVGCEVAMELKVNKEKNVMIVELADELMKAIPPVPTPVKMCLTDMAEYYGIDVRCSSSVVEILDDAVVVKQADGSTEKVKADNVVLAAGFKAVESFEQQLYENGFEVYSIGNGAPTANVLQATAEAYEIVNRL